MTPPQVGLKSRAEPTADGLARVMVRELRPGTQFRYLLEVFGEGVWVDEFPAELAESIARRFNAEKYTTGLLTRSNYYRLTTRRKGQ